MWAGDDKRDDPAATYAAEVMRELMERRSHEHGHRLTLADRWDDGHDGLHLLDGRRLNPALRRWVDGFLADLTRNAGERRPVSQRQRPKTPARRRLLFDDDDDERHLDWPHLSNECYLTGERDLDDKPQRHNGKVRQAEHLPSSPAETCRRGTRTSGQEKGEEGSCRRGKRTSEQPEGAAERRRREDNERRLAEETRHRAEQERQVAEVHRDAKQRAEDERQQWMIEARRRRVEKEARLAAEEAAYQAEKERRHAEESERRHKAALKAKVEQARQDEERRVKAQRLAEEGRREEERRLRQEERRARLAEEERRQAEERRARMSEENRPNADGDCGDDDDEEFFDALESPAPAAVNGVRTSEPAERVADDRLVPFSVKLRPPTTTPPRLRRPPSSSSSSSSAATAFDGARASAAGNPVLVGAGGSAVPSSSSSSSSADDEKTPQQQRQTEPGPSYPPYSSSSTLRMSKAELCSSSSSSSSSTDRVAHEARELESNLARPLLLPTGLEEVALTAAPVVEKRHDDNVPMHGKTVPEKLDPAPPYDPGGQDFDGDDDGGFRVRRGDVVAEEAAARLHASYQGCKLARADHKCDGDGIGGIAAPVKMGGGRIVAGSVDADRPPPEPPPFCL